MFQISNERPFGYLTIFFFVMKLTFGFMHISFLSTDIVDGNSTHFSYESVK